MAEAGRWTRWQVLAALLAIGVAAVFAVLLLVAMLANPEHTDFMVYRGSVQTMLEGGSLYGYSLNGQVDQGLGFTYPPFAGLALVWIGLVPLPVGLVVWTLAQLAFCVLLALIVWLRTPASGRVGPAESRLAVGVIAAALLLGEPVTHGTSIGQVSLAVVLLVVADAVLPDRWRGVLTGIAAAIKLTPLVLLPYYLVTRQWRAARNLGLGLAGATALAFAVLPGDSLRYWTSLVFATGRVGEVSARRNKSLLGMLAHLGLDGPALPLVWLGLAAVVAALALWRAARHHRRGEELAAVLVVGVLSTVLSPISWPHHLVWASLVAIQLVLSPPRWAKALGVVLWLGLVVGTPLMGFDDVAPAWLAYPEALVTLALVAVAVLGLPWAAVDAEPDPAPVAEAARPAEAA